MDSTKDLKNKTLSEVEAVAEQFGHKRYAGAYIFSFVHSKGCRRIEDISPLSKAFRGELIEGGYYISALKQADKRESKDGSAKYLFEFSDGEMAEAVLLADDDRRTLCLSTQVGCAMGCGFCATAGLGYKRNLTAGEICDEVYAVQADGTTVTNVVYMGMGEPLANYENVMRSVEILNHPQGRGLGIRHITISTCGLTEKIRMLSEEKLVPRLAISLNSADETTRSKLMPINKKYGLKSLKSAIQHYQAKTGRRVTFEYVLIKDVNDSVDNAKKLLRFTKGLKCNINVISLNSHPGCKYEPSSKRAISAFVEILTDAGVEVVVRKTLGDDIFAACGQLGAEMKKTVKIRRIVDFYN
jgi:23S rRNA (adenine2503-C2)-methyltransferase